MGGRPRADWRNMEDKRTHLQMIQAVITRLSGNSFLIKGWTVTLVSALFALAVAGTSPFFVYLAYFPAFAFWSLDAYFLRQEKLFRSLYEHVSGLPPSEINYSMSTAQFEPEAPAQLTVAFSRTLRLFHGTTTATIIVVMLVLMCSR